MPCFYTPQLQVNSSLLSIEGDEFHHIVHVFRKKEEEEIVLTSGTGLLATAKIAKINKKNLLAAILQIYPKKKSSPQIALAFALLKNKRDHLLIEKTTELGVAQFFPYTCSRSVRKSSDHTIEKFKKTVIAAGKQCDNANFPTISPTLTFAEMIEHVKQNNFLPIAAYENEQNRLLTDFFPDKIASDYCLLVGPEGGFSADEIAIMAEKEVPLISLGNHILRAETAAICGIGTLLQLCLKHDRNYY